MVMVAVVVVGVGNGKPHHLPILTSRASFVRSFPLLPYFSRFFWGGASCCVDRQAGGDLLPEEWKDVWDSAPKSSPGIAGGAGGTGDYDDTAALIDLDSFVQIYRDVDDLFEDNDEDDDDDDDVQASPVENDASATTAAAATVDDDDDTEEQVGGMDAAELERIYQSICNQDKLISRDALSNWNEIRTLMSDGLLGADEFDDLWEKATRERPIGTGDFLDLNSFLRFNVALDSLFEFNDDDEVDDGELEIAGAPTNTVDAISPPLKGRAMVEEGDNPPSVLFAQLADGNRLVGMDELKLWIELQEMLEGGDLLPSELQEMYDEALSADSSGKLTEQGFLQLYDSIDALFDDENETDEDSSVPAERSQYNKNSVKEDLLSFLDIIKEDSDETMLPCGLEANEADQKQVLNIVKVLEEQPSNLIVQKKGDMELSDLVGTWILLYSSSSAMKFNNGLSGIAGSFPNGRCAGVKQKLNAKKFLNEVEYKERIEMKPSSASFDVTVTGSWDLRTSVSLFTGRPSIVLTVEPDRVNYGPTSTRADHWKSLGPLNMLDLSYLDGDLRVMRGCTSADTLFIFKKES
jgi:hypothetical protein